MSTTLNNKTLPYASTYFNQHYLIEYNYTKTLSKALCTKTLFDNLKYLFSNPADFFVSLKVYPINLNIITPHSSSISPVRFGNVDTGARGYKVDNYNYYHSLCSFNITQEHKNYLDYAPYTKLELYLPYYGFLELDNNLVMNKHIDIKLSIDYDTGIATYWIIANGTMVQSVNFQLGYDIPLGSTNANDNARNMLNSTITLAGSVVSSIAMENPLPLVMGGLSYTQSALNSLQTRVFKGNAGSGKSSFVNPTSIYAITTTAKEEISQESYAHLKGLPLNEVHVLGDLSGFTTVDASNLENFGTATKTECDEILSLLRSGIIL